MAGLLTACSPADEVPAAGDKLDANEAKALEEAAEMLDEQRLVAKAGVAATASPVPNRTAAGR